MIALPALPRKITLTHITIIQIIALTPPAVFVLFESSSERSILLVSAIITALFWENLFAIGRKQAACFYGLGTAIIIAIIIPINLPIWQLVLMLSLGIILGELIFGSRGFSFLSPATVCLSLLVFSFPQVQLEPVSEMVAIATLPGALLLFALGFVSWRIIVATTLTIMAFTVLLGQLPEFGALFSALIFYLIFLISDPQASAATDPGRWLYGILTGFLVSFFSMGTEFVIKPEAIIFAALLGSIFAPLIDHLVVLAKVKKREKHHV